ncbi:bestrophin-4-like [Saccoglossus kowalevskii]|uniref:Bestrophin homolog n=1 Tax=Saccoglossus kowalevskii TaxID=10224 RepID=A0ABM0GLZ5_SACKO|nr:PREDICTED: bestrophin-2-like [Saccoglossus kowalevskii]
MTVTYSLKVSKASLTGFSSLLFRWKGSIYKLLYREMAVFIALYYILSIVYRHALQESQKRVFEKLALYAEKGTNIIPLSFILGFYVAIIVGRWWSQYLAIPWIDQVAQITAANVHGADDRSRMIRRSIVRWVNASAVLVLTSVSPPIKRRFPTMWHYERAGLFTEDERQMLEDTLCPHSKFWVPCAWACNLVAEARREGRIRDDFASKAIIDEIQKFRDYSGMIYAFDWISVPLVYTQVVTLAVYSYFVSCLVARQFLDPKQGYVGHDIDLYIPFFTILEFFFYFGWLKVAEAIINPFGEDDDDFEVNFMVDRNLQVGLLTVDEMYGKHPKLDKDMYWDKVVFQMPYTKASISHKRENSWMGSTTDMHMGEDTFWITTPGLDTITEISRQTIINAGNEFQHLTNTPPDDIDNALSLQRQGSKESTAKKIIQSIVSRRNSHVQRELSNESRFHTPSNSRIHTPKITPMSSPKLTTRVERQVSKESEASRDVSNSSPFFSPDEETNATKFPVVQESTETAQLIDMDGGMAA